MDFKTIIYTVAQIFSGKVLSVSDNRYGNFTFAEVELTDFDKEHFFILHSNDNQWAFSKPILKSSYEITFIDKPLVEKEFRKLFGIEVHSKGTLNSRFERMRFMDKSWDKDLMYWKPKTLGEALFNWWD